MQCWLGSGFFKSGKTLKQTFDWQQWHPDSAASSDCEHNQWKYQNTKIGNYQVETTDNEW